MDYIVLWVGGMVVGLVMGFFVGKEIGATGEGRKP